jgi:uncharacterized protein (TIGR00369 family)
MTTVASSGSCLICGRNNPIGIHAEFLPAEGGVQCIVKPGKHFQGYDGILHGGIVAALMDDGMCYAVTLDGPPVVTAELQIRYKAPVPVDRQLVVTASRLESRRNLFCCKAEISLDGKILASATGKFIAVKRR